MTDGLEAMVCFVSWILQERNGCPWSLTYIRKREKTRGKDEVSLDVRQTVVPTTNTRAQNARGQDRVYNIVKSRPRENRDGSRDEMKKKEREKKRKRKTRRRRDEKQERRVAANEE